ncbi:hypothetical protein K3495_g7339 [Podosphaera aphanis]|nr:hypothetical protein K3495_g7339 [Podosphaera aphanis]
MEDPKAIGNVEAEEADVEVKAELESGKGIQLREMITVAMPKRNEANVIRVGSQDAGKRTVGRRKERMRTSIKRKCRSWYELIMQHYHLGRRNLYKNHKARATIRACRQLVDTSQKSQAIKILCCLSIIGWILLVHNFILRLGKRLSFKANAYPALTTYAFFTKDASITTLIDSGASQHFSGIRQDFQSLKRWESPRPLRVADGKIIHCEGRGTIKLKSKKGRIISFDNVWFVPEFGKLRLLSMNEFNKWGVDVLFVNQRCRVVQNGKILFDALSEDGVYKVKEDIKVKDKVLNVESSTPNQTSSYQDENPATETEWEILHRRLGHINYNDVDHVLKNGDTGITSPSNKRRVPLGERSCESCSAGRLREHFNKRTDNRCEAKLRRVHCDISGIQAVTVRGYRYFLMVVDDATRYCWIRLLKTKEMVEVLSAFKEIKRMAEVESAGEIVYVRADNGKSEFGHEFQSYCREVGIQLEPSPPYKLSMNGVVERWMRSTKTIARSILYEARLPHQLWDYAIEHAVWIKNRVPTAALPFGQFQKKTPFEAYHGKLPSLKNLKVFGSKADVLYPPDLNSQTWVPRTREGKFIMIGMRSSKIWRLLDISTLREVYSSDAKFNEYSFRSIDSINFTQSSSEETPVQSMHREIMPISGRPKGVEQKSKVNVPMCPMEIDHHPPLTVIAPVKI